MDPIVGLTKRFMVVVDSSCMHMTIAIRPSFD